MYLLRLIYFVAFTSLFKQVCPETAKFQFKETTICYISYDIPKIKDLWFKLTPNREITITSGVNGAIFISHSECI